VRRPWFGPWAIGALALVVIAGLAWFTTRAPRRAGGPPPDPAHAMAAPDAYREAIRLANADRRTESFAFFRRALEGLATDSWEVRYNYGITLASDAIQYVPRAGEPRLATRSSVERVGLLSEAMRQLDRASRLAPNPSARAQVLSHFANLLAVWGFPWETLDLMRRTEYADPTDPVPAARAVLYLKMMKDPPLYAGDVRLEQVFGDPAAGVRSRR